MLLIVLVAGGGAASRTSAPTTATATIVATEDGYVSSTRPSKSFGNAGRLEVDARPAVRSYGLGEVTDSPWSEGSLRYATAPALSGPIGVNSGPLDPRQVISLDVTRSVNADIRSFALVGRRGAEVLAVGSSESARLGSNPRLVVTFTPPALKRAPCGTLAEPRRVRHVIWVWMENKPYHAIIGSPSAPYENALAAACGLATNYHSVTHPSLPNYIAATSGKTWGITDDAPPAAHPLNVASIYSRVKAAGKTWRDYQENAPRNCPLASSGRYTVRHDPAPYYTDIRGDCVSWDVPMGTTENGSFLSDLSSGTLPAFALVTPNLCNDTHDCPVSTGDAWLKSWIPRILASPNYLAGNTVVFLTWDEDDGSAGNRIPMIVIAPSVRAGTHSAGAFDHYALLKTTQQLLG